MSDLETYPNIGPKLARELYKAGVTNYEKLVELGSVAAAVRITRGRPHTGYNLLYALEGAIRGVRWHAIPKEDRALIRAEYDRKVSTSS